MLDNEARAYLLAVERLREIEEKEPGTEDARAIRAGVAAAEAAAAADPKHLKEGVHKDITCDHSGMDPIVGMRYELIGDVDWDLCEAEWDKLPAQEKLHYTAHVPPLPEQHDDSRKRLV